jgi:hypothetical protein
MIHTMPLLLADMAPLPGTGWGAGVAGASVGNAVGDVVGAGVGKNGAGVGDLEGLAVGRLLGVVVGVPVGSFVLSPITVDPPLNANVYWEFTITSPAAPPHEMLQRRVPSTASLHWHMLKALLYTAP